MCGITGAIWADPQLALDEPTLRRMTAELTHRGPDDEGYYLSPWQTRVGYPPRPGVALGHRRLSIIDLSGGHQPLPNENDTVWVVFNGEIYNFPALRQRLEGSGHTFRTQSDTETLVHLYEDEGLGFLKHLQGMFALALWDARRGRLVIARDRLGKKPLYYRHERGRLLFGSELKALLAVPGVPREIDPGAIDEYLTYQYVPHPNTMFRGLRKLPPAHYAVFGDGDFRVSDYWDPLYDREVDLPDEEYRRQLRERLTESVEMRLVSDVPLGAFLSGGVDSSLIVALMQQAQVGRPVRTFSIGFAEAEYDETQHARAIADHLGTQHTELRIEPSAVEILPQLVWHFDDPLADSSAIPTWYVAQLAREHVTVALTGDGGDELFAGYDRYRAAPLGAAVDRLPALVRNALGSSVWQRLPGTRRRSLLRRFKRLTEPLALPPPRRYLEWIAVFNESQRASLYSEEMLRRLPDSDPAEFLATAWRRVGHRDPVTQASLADLQTYLPCDLLAKVDITSMAHSLECRQPMLDQRVVELAVGMPRRLKYRRGRGKRILQETFGHLLPESVFKRPKMGFGVPLEHWFRGSLGTYAREVLLDPVATGRGYFRTAAVEALLNEHQAGKQDHSPRLWALLFLEIWHHRWVDAP
ncbi:MAG: asparagine synthase (glutamine-hydrolyzing) [Planctomycetes bacterium]|nr:asparagine synthase (glutamine-hydrolyzing) [Planctomycetota bacterium]